MVFVLYLCWSAVHWWVVSYGTQDVPLTKAYVGDEQSPLIGALHMAKEKSPFGLRNNSSVYYGPIFSVVVFPAVVLDYASGVLAGSVHSASDYQRLFVINWGPALFKARWMSVLVGFLGLCGLWLLLKQFAGQTKRWWLWLGVLVLATNFYYFLYSGWLRHWVYITAALIFQLYFLVKIKEQGKTRYWVGMALASIFSFGISYISLLYQAMWLPVLIAWWREKRKADLKHFGWFILGLAILVGLVVFWNPSPYIRLWSFMGTESYGLGTSILPSAWYYLGILLFNQPFLILAFLVAMFCSLRLKLYKTYWFWSILAVALVHFLFFSMSPHSEPRYILPLMVCLLGLTMVVAIKLNQDATYKNFVGLIAVLLVLEIVFQASHDVKYSQLAASGPEERQLIAYMQSLPENKTILYEGNRLLGVLQDKTSFRDYVDVCLGTVYNLHAYLLGVDLPQNPKPLHLDYLCQEKTTGKMPLEKYDYRFEPNGYELSSNFFEERIIRLWFADQERQRYLALPGGQWIQ